MATTQDVVDRLEAGRSRLLALIAPYADGTLAHKGVVGEWSIKDVLAHLSGWERLVVRITPERLATGRQSPLILAMNADEDGSNARQIAESEALSVAAQLAELTAARQALLAYVRSLGDEGLGQAHPWDTWEGTLGDYLVDAVGGHEREHVEALAAAVAGLPPDRVPPS
jgi:hypothetical protein